MAFHVGQKVVCVDARRCYRNRKTDLVKGHVYRVLAVCVVSGECGLVVDGAQSWHSTGSYHVKRFRPAVERKTSTETGMAILRKIADDASNKTLVPVDGE